MEREEKKKKWNRALVLGAVFFLAGLLLQLGARGILWFGEWYALQVYPGLAATWGRLWGLFPFSVSEIGIYILVAAAVCWGIKNRRSWGKLLGALWVALSVVFLLFTANCGINYYRNPFSSYSGLEIKAHSEEELRELVAWLTVRVNETSGRRWDQNGNKLAAGPTGEEGVKAMERLGQIYPQLGGYYPKPKPVLVSRILTVQQITGIYSPFTIEANYNREIPDYNIPHTVCHELSHLKGFMREDEANFIGYLACIGSGDIRFEYSGYLCGWIYAGNALYKVNREAYYEYLNQLDGRIRDDLCENSLFWDRFDTRISEAANQMNDAYLKINSQKDGVKSYGRVVDLMIAHYQKTEAVRPDPEVLP